MEGKQEMRKDGTGVWAVGLMMRGKIQVHWSEFHGWGTWGIGIPVVRHIFPSSTKQSKNENDEIQPPTGGDTLSIRRKAYRTPMLLEHSMTQYFSSFI